MEHVSLHGLVFAGIQLLVVLGLHWALHQWHKGPTHRASHSQVKGMGSTKRERSPRGVHGVPLLVGLGFVAWYIVLRTRPAARGADPFEFTLGLFDGITLAGLSTLILMHLVLTRHMDPKNGDGGDDPPDGEPTSERQSDHG